MAEKISVRIGLEGGEEVEKQLADVGKAGEDAFKQIEQASTQASFDKVADDINKAGTASEKTAEKITELGGATTEAVKATDGLAQAQSNLTLQSAKTVAEIGKLAAETVKTGVETYKLIHKHESWISKLIELGTNATKASGSIGVLTSFLGPYGKIVGTVVGLTLLASKATEDLGSAAGKTAKPFAEIAKTLSGLVESTGLASEDLQRTQALFGQLGVSAETFGSTINKITKDLEDLDADDEIKESADAIVAANKKVLEAEKAVMDNRVVGSRTPLIDEGGKQLTGVLGYVEGLKQLHVEQTKAKKLQDDLVAARKDAAEASANSLSKVVEQVEAIEQGDKNIKFDSMVKADTVSKAFAISLQKVTEEGKNAGEVLVKFIAIADRAQAIQIGKKFGLSDEDVERIRLLGGNLTDVDNIWRRLQRAGVLIPPASAQAFKELTDETTRFEAAQTRLAQAKEGTIFATLGAQVDTFTLKLKTGFINVEAAVIEFGNMLVSIAWDAVSTGAVIAWNSVITGAALAGNAIISFVGNIAGIVWDSISSAGVTAWNNLTAAIGRAFPAVGQFITWLGSLDWSLVSAGVNAWNGISTAISNAVTWVGSFVSSMATIVWDTLTSAGVAAWDAVTSAIGRAYNKLVEYIQKAAGLFGSGSSGGAPAGAAPGMAGGGVIGGRGSGTSDSNLAWVSRGEYIMPARVVRRPGMLAFLEGLRGGGRSSSSRGGLPAFAEGGSVGGGIDNIISVIASVRNMIDDAAQSIGQLTFTMVDGMRDVVNGIDRVMRSFSEVTYQLVHETLRKASDTLWDFEQMLKEAQGHASGGLLGGRGTGRSDSNLAWVSRGEHIMPAYAVRRPGVLEFLEALRRSGGNLSRVLNGFGRYAAGGLIMPSLASAATGSMSNVTIQFPGLPSISGLRASSQVVDELQRAAAMAQVRSGGRKPSRYR